MKPNIFDISTKEAGQDAFITWLLQWADTSNTKDDINLNKCAVDFVTEIIKTNIPNFDEEIKSIRAGRQWENIDVWAEVNDKYLIIIEDKINADQHSDQLTRYKKTAEDWCKNQDTEYKPPICIYLITGNKSPTSLKKVEEKGFKIYNRQAFLSLLQKHEIKNDIYNDFKSHLLYLEKLNNEWETKIIKEWEGHDWQGFFQYLEQTNIGLVGWQFVNNPSGGFWGAVLNWNYWEIYPVYLQIEESKLCFKISTDPYDVEMPDNTSQKEIRDKFSAFILNSAENKKLTVIKRPNRFRCGKYMTVAVIESSDWLGDTNKEINKEIVTEKLLKYKKFLLETI